MLEGRCASCGSSAEEGRAGKRCPSRSVLGEGTAQTVELHLDKAVEARTANEGKSPGLVRWPRPVAAPGLGWAGDWAWVGLGWADFEFGGA